MNLTLEEQLKVAIEIAYEGHAGQVDKGGNDYILHPLMVMSLVTELKEKIVAVLHDVPEDTKFDLPYLREKGIDEEMVEAVDSVTKRKRETYDQALYRAFQNPIGINVKIKDMTVNSDLTRIPNPTEKDYARTEKYKRGIRILTEKDWHFDGTAWTKNNE